MKSRPKIRLSRLRDIGWSNWDPIGLLESESWEGVSYADEYDTYLIRAAGMIRRGELKSHVVDYLLSIEAEHMGLGFRKGARKRALQVVNLIADDDQLWNHESC